MCYEFLLPATQVYKASQGLAQVFALASSVKCKLGNVFT